MMYADRLLAQKLERAEARSNRAIVETHARVMPKSHATWIKIAGAYAMFDGVSSPLTQTFGLGLFHTITDVELDEIEKFFKIRHAPVFHEVSPLAEANLLLLLNKRAYQPVEFTSVMFRSLDTMPNFSPENPLLKTRIINDAEHDVWAKTAALGWANEGEGLSDFMLEFGKISAQCPQGYPFIVERDNQPIATAMLFICDDVALLGGASTIPTERKKGAQRALLAARLEFSKNRGLKVAMMCAAPGSQSQRNAESNDFRIAYTRIKWFLKGC